MCVCGILLPHSFVISSSKKNVADTTQDFTTI